MKIFLAGATGVIGRALVPILVEAGHEVAGMARNAAEAGLLPSLGARAFIVDVFDRSTLFAVMQSDRFDAVIHELTSLSAGSYALNNRIRAQGTRNLVDAALAAGIRRRVAQSFCLYPPGEELAHEQDPLDSSPTAFGGSGAGIRALEAAVGEVPDGVVLRYGTLYGPGTWLGRDGRGIEQIRQGRYPVPAGDITSFLHVEDAAGAALAALAWPWGVVNVVDDEPAAARDWVPVLAGALGVPPPEVSEGASSVSPSRPVSNGKARSSLGWVPRYPSWRQGFVSSSRAAERPRGRPSAGDARV